MRLWIVKAVKQEFDFAVTDVYSEMVFCYVFDVVGLVDDDEVVIGEEAGGMFFEDEIAKEQCVVCNDDICGF